MTAKVSSQRPVVVSPAGVQPVEPTAPEASSPSSSEVSSFVAPATVSAASSTLAEQEAPTAQPGGLGWGEASASGALAALGPVRSAQEVQAHLAASGFVLESSEPGEVQVRTAAQMTARQIISAAFGATQTELGDFHIQAFAQANPELASGIAQLGSLEVAFPAGVSLSLSGLPVGLELLIAQWGAQLASLPQEQKTALGAPLKAQLGQAQVLRNFLAGLDAAARAKARGEALPEQYSAHVNQVAASGHPQAPQQAKVLAAQKLGQTLQTLQSEAGRAAGEGQLGQVHEKFEAARGLLLEAAGSGSLNLAEHASHLEKRAASFLVEANALSLVAGMPRHEGASEDEKKLLKHVEQGIVACVEQAQQAFTQLASSLESSALGVEGEAKAGLLTYAQAMRERAASVQADLHSCMATFREKTGDAKGAVDAISSAAAATVGLTAPAFDSLLSADSHQTFAAEGAERKFWRVDHLIQMGIDWVHDDAIKKIGSLSPKKLEAAVEQLHSLPEDKRAELLDLLIRRGELAAAASDSTTLNVTQQVLHGLAKKLSLPDLEVRAQALTGQYLLAMGDSEKAHAAFKSMRTQAASLSDEASRQGLQAQAAMGEAQALLISTMSFEKHALKGEASKALTALREEMEQPGSPLEKDLLAELMMTELTAHLQAHRAEEAKKLLGHMRAGIQKDVPWLKPVLDAWEQKNKNNRLVAGTQVALKELTSESGLEQTGVIVAGIGAQILSRATGGGGGLTGAVFGGLTAALKLRNLVRGSSEIQQAATTGYNSEKWAQSLSNIAMLASDGFMVAAPTLGAKRGLEVATGLNRGAGLGSLYREALGSVRSGGYRSLATPAAGGEFRAVSDQLVRRTFLPTFVAGTVAGIGFAKVDAGLHRKDFEQADALKQAATSEG